MGWGLLCGGEADAEDSSDCWRDLPHIDGAEVAAVCYAFAENEEG